MIFDSPRPERPCRSCRDAPLCGDVVILTDRRCAWPASYRRHRAGSLALVDRIMIPFSITSLVGCAPRGCPVINGLTRLSHPCQVMADVMTSKIQVQIGGHTAPVLATPNGSPPGCTRPEFDFRLKVATPP